jgi:hypothetical protein
MGQNAWRGACYQDHPRASPWICCPIRKVCQTGWGGGAPTAAKAPMRGKLCGRDTVAARRLGDCSDLSHEDVCTQIGGRPAHKRQASEPRRDAAGGQSQCASGSVERRCIGNVDSRGGPTCSRSAGCSQPRCSRPAGGGGAAASRCKAQRKRQRKTQRKILSSRGRESSPLPRERRLRPRAVR